MKTRGLGTCLFVVSWPQSQIIQAVGGHVPNCIEKPGVGDGLHTQLSGQRERRKWHQVTRIVATTTQVVSYNNFITRFCFTYWELDNYMLYFKSDQNFAHLLLKVFIFRQYWVLTVLKVVLI